MSLRKFLFIPLVVSLAFFVYYSSEVESSFRTLTTTIHFTTGFIVTLVLAIVLQLVGHIVRAFKAQYLLHPVKESSTRFQFRALSIGYLFDTILPLRLGELIRARIISDAMTISFSLSLTLILIERAIDALILGILGLIIVPVFIGGGQPNLIIYSLLLIALATLFMSFVVLAVGEKTKLLRFLHKTTALFNVHLKDSLRFKVWSVIYGVHSSLPRRRLIPYVAMSLISWVFYFASTAVIAFDILKHQAAGHKILAAMAPYFGVAVPSGPANLGVFSHITNDFMYVLHLSRSTSITFDLTTWAVLVIPISAIALMLLFFKTKESLWQSRPAMASQQALVNKLYRSEDISREMANFLENYFSGNSLSRIVHRLELKDDFRLLKYFKGGSDAITILALQNGKEVVKKIIPIEFEDRLKAQYLWLLSRKGKDGIVEVIKEYKAKDYYAIDLAYSPEDIMFFDYMHSNPYIKSQEVMDEVWTYLFKSVYGNTKKLATYPGKRNTYIKKHVFDCMDKASTVNADLLRAVKPEKIIINGNEYDNLYQIMDKIKKHPKAWKDIATYRESEFVHGDVAVDNILVSSKSQKARIIDPAPDGNIISGPVFDFGKNMQSLYCGYEFMLRDEEPVYLIDNEINYKDHSSAQYTRLCEYVQNKLAPTFLSKSEQRALLFHAGVLHIRRLKHQVYYNPANTLKFYAIGVKTLNDFLDQYNKA